MIPNVPIILASQSPRRQELLIQGGFTFTVEPSTVEETITTTIPSDVVLELSKQKARDVCKKHTKETVIVIGADTIVSYNGTIMGKPASREHAFSMLSALQGNTHQVYTGVTLCFNTPKGLTTHSFYACTDVTFYPMSDEEIHSYIATEEPMDKAGAYGIQGGCAIYIQEIKGDYNNVVGLPLAMLYQEMSKVLSSLES